MGTHRKHSGRVIVWSLLAALCGVGCTGLIGDAPMERFGAGPDEVEDPGSFVDGRTAERCDAIDVPAAGHTPLRRLTRVEYERSVRDVFGVPVDARDVLGGDEAVGGFSANTVAPIDELLTERFADLAETVATEVAAAPETASPCDLGALGEDACAERFIADVAGRAFRRPPSAEQLDGLRALYAIGRDGGGHARGLELVVSAVLQSAEFLYRVETGVVEEGRLRLDGFSIASRLSYLLWKTTPDDALLASAEAGALDEVEGVRAQAERLLSDERAAEGIASFHLQWLGVDGIEDLGKDSASFPEFDGVLARAMRDETARFADYVIRRGDGRIETLLTADYSLLEGPLFALYGVEEPPGHDPSEPVAMPSGERAGLLTQASFLATHASPSESSPVRRGVRILDRLLCTSVPPPPPSVNDVLPANDPEEAPMTTRERLAQHREDPSCASCHTQIDGIGLGLESYDAIGAFRTEEHGVPIDASGEVHGDHDAAGPFDGAVELAGRLAGSERVARCITQQWMWFALARNPEAVDSCAMEAIYREVADSGGDVRALILALVSSDAFRYSRVPEGL